MSAGSDISTSISFSRSSKINMGSFSNPDGKTDTDHTRDGDTRFRFLKSIASAYRLKVQVSCEAREYHQSFKLISKEESMIAMNRKNASRTSTCSTIPRDSNLNFKMSDAESQTRFSYSVLRSNRSRTESLQKKQSVSAAVGRLKSHTNNTCYQQLGSFIGLNKLPRRTSTSQNCSIYSSSTGSRHNQTEKIPYHPSFIEPVHCVGIRNNNRRNSNTCMNDENDDYEIPFCDCSKNFHDYDADPNCPSDNPCGSLKSRLCAPPGSQAFAPIPFEKPKTVFGDFTVPDEWKLKDQRDDCIDCDDTSKSSQTEISQADCPEGEELFCPDEDGLESNSKNSKNPNAINYDAIGDVDDYFVDRNVIKLCPQLLNFCPEPFASPKNAFSDFKCAAGSGSGSGTGSSRGTENSDDCICENESYNSGCKECLQNLQRELRAGTLSGRSTSCRCRFQYNPNKICCKESFDEFVARKRWEAQLEELTRVQNEKRAAADAAAAKAKGAGAGGACNCDACAKQCAPEEEDCDCYCPDDMECYMEDTTEDCLMDLEAVSGDDCDCPCPCDDQLEPEEIPICTESDDLAANNCSTGDDGEGDAGAGAETETETGACAEGKGSSDCAACCEEPTPCQQKIFDMKAQLLVADANHEKELLKKDLDHYKEKIQGYQSTILKVQSKLRLHQQKQREHLKKKCACIKKKAAEKQEIQNELDCYRRKLEEMQRRLETYQRKEGQLRATANNNNNARGSSHSFPSRAPSPCHGPKPTRLPSSLFMQNSKQPLPRGMGPSLGLGQPLGTTACHGQGQGQGPRTNIPLPRMRSQQSFPLPGQIRSPERQRSSANVPSCGGGGGGARIPSQAQGQAYYQGQGQGQIQRSKIPVAVASASMSNSNFIRQKTQNPPTGSQCGTGTAGQNYGKGRPEAKNTNTCGFKVAKKSNGCCWGGWEEIPPWQPPAKKVAATSTRTDDTNNPIPGCAGPKILPPTTAACPGQNNRQVQPPQVPQRSSQGQERKC